MGLLGNAKINVRIHFGIIVLAALAGGAAILIWGGSYCWFVGARRRYGCDV